MDSLDTSTRLSESTPRTLNRHFATTARDWLLTLRARLGTRGLIILALAATAAIGYSKWGWLVAIGAAPLILALLPCAAMCALGMCMKPKRGGSSTASAPMSDQPAADPNRLIATKETAGTTTTGKEKKSCSGN